MSEQSIKYWSGMCPVCGEGRLFVMKPKESQDIFLLCEECESSWRTPEEVNPATHFAADSSHASFATAEEIKRAGWTEYHMEVGQN